jgi:hypothetical protein
MHHRSKSARTSTLTSAWFFRVSRLTGLVLMIGLTWQFCGIGVARADDNGLAWCLDIDGDGTIRAETDGILLLRWLFGFRGSVLIDGVTDPNGHRVTANAITAFLLRWDQFDADNDGVADALTDGLIAQRWLSGLRGAELVSGLLGYNCENPEAEETENLYLHTALATDAQAIWRYRLQADAADYETDHPAVEPRMLYVAEQRLWERRMDTLGNWIGEAHPLTDNTIKSPQNPDYACHARGAVVYFDASTSMTTERPRRDIYRLDLNNTTVRRLTNDPEGNSQDFAPTISADGTRIAFASTRAGTHGEITIAPTDLGLGAGMGNRLAPGDDCVWHPSLDILACADRSNRYVHPVHIGYSNLFLLDVGDAGQMMLIPERSGSISDPSWNPSGIRLAYALHDANDLPNGVYVVDRTGGDPLLVVGNGGHPAWLTDNQIVFHRADANGELDLFLVSVNGGAGGAEIRLTPQDGRSIEQPAHVRCP